jgi:hypothetical protein
MWTMLHPMLVEGEFDQAREVVGKRSRSRGWV